MLFRTKPFLQVSLLKFHTFCFLNFYVHHVISYKIFPSSFLTKIPHFLLLKSFMSIMLFRTKPFLQVSLLKFHTFCFLNFYVDHVISYKIFPSSFLTKIPHFLFLKSFMSIIFYPTQPFLQVSLLKFHTFCFLKVLCPSCYILHNLSFKFLTKIPHFLFLKSFTSIMLFPTKLLLVR